MGTEQKPKMTTTLSQWNNAVTGLVTRDFENNGVNFDEYSKKCAMNAMSAIYQLVVDTDKTTMNDIDISNLGDVVSNVASRKLNANAEPSECYFQLRSKQINGEWKKIVEMHMQGDGYDALLRNFGVDVKTVYPCWVVGENDKFIPPKYKGIKVTDPEWEPSLNPGKCVRVVYPIELNNGSVVYRMSDRDSVMGNLKAHVISNMMNETFGIVKGTKKDRYGKEVARNRYDATPEEKELIAKRKEEILAELCKCNTVEEMVACEVARPYMSGAWVNSTESMIVRKMRNNAIRKFPKNYNSLARKYEAMEQEVYQVAQAEISQNANAEEFEPVDVELSEELPVE